MTCFVALATLDTLSRTRLRALFGVVAFLLAIFAGVGVEALLGTIARAVTLFRTVDALDGRSHGDLLGLLLLAVLKYVS